MPGYRIAPNSGEAYSDLEIRSCPIADMNRVASIITNYNRIKTGLIEMKDIYPHPTSSASFSPFKTSFCSLLNLP